jgi:hypothetical protein
MEIFENYHLTRIYQNYLLGYTLKIAICCDVEPRKLILVYQNARCHIAVRTSNLIN